MISASEYKRYIDFAFEAYQLKNTSGQEFRQNGHVPYLNHPLWCATTLLHDVDLPWEIREVGFKTLLLHDVSEDTSAEFPDWVEPEVRRLVKEMTHENFLASLSHIPGKEILVKLLTLVDKLATLTERHLKDDTEKRRKWIELVRYLADEVEAHYGRTRITIMARAITSNTTSW
jgi:(p)ppGpp synthase/HD superfamily hydrolase